MLESFLPCVFNNRMDKFVLVSFIKFSSSKFKSQIQMILDIMFEEKY